MKQIIYKSLFVLCFLFFLSIANSQKNDHIQPWYEPQVVSTFKADSTPVDKTTFIYNKWGQVTSELRENFMNNAWKTGYKRTHTYKDSTSDKLSTLMQVPLNENLVNYTLESYTYNMEGRTLTHTNQKWTDEQWVNSQRTEWTYDAQGNNLVKQQAIWKNANWENTLGNTYTYNNKNEKLSDISDNRGVNDQKTTWLYDNAGNMLTETIEKWSGKDNKWTKNARHTRTYNLFNQELICTNESGKDTLWAYNWRRTTTYDNQQNKTSELRENWRNAIWIIERRYTWTYFASSNLIKQHLSELYTNNAFVNYESTEFTYNERGKQITKVLNRWAHSSSSWAPANRYFIEYDPQGNIVKDVGERWQTDKWLDMYNFDWSYDTNGNSILFHKIGSGMPPSLNYNNMQSKYDINAPNYAKAVASFINVNEKLLIPVSEITLSDTILTMEVGDKVQLIASVLPLDASNRAVGWSSSNGNVKVNDSGLITAVLGGDAVITVTTLEGGFTAQCKVKVNKTSVKQVILSDTAIELNIGKNKRLSATIVPANATNPQVRWQSSKNNIAMVSNLGVITAISKGVTYITITSDDGGHTDTCTITVTEITNIDALNQGDINIYLTNEQINIESKVKISDVQVRCLMGRLIYQSKTLYPISTSSWSSGVYIIHLFNSEKVIKTQKIIVK